MDDLRTIDDLKDLGAGIPAPEAGARAYHQAFAAFGTQALWNWRELDQPTITQVLAIADSLRMEGNLAARALAVRIEAACRAAL
jgi:hypothetical protein